MAGSKINVQRIVNEFCDLVLIDSTSKKERHMADEIKRKLEAMGLDVQEDDAGTKIGGDSGNLICRIKSNYTGNRVPALVFLSHLDTVVPGSGKKAIIEDGIIKTDGSTVLGGDDLAGVVSMLESLRKIEEEGIKHGDIIFVFTVAEELGLLGSKNMDCTSIKADYGFVLDSGGSVGKIDVRAPAQYNFDVEIRGKAAHSGMEPENGINAILIASDAISGMKQGRIDEETTANIGIINGGYAVNIVCDRVSIRGEARSRNPAKLEAQLQHMKSCFEDSAEKHGGSVTFKPDFLYGSFDIPEDALITKLLKKAADSIGIRLQLESTGGGSDTNILNGCGIETVNISVGMEKVHTTSEYIRIDDIVKTVDFMVAVIKTAVTGEGL